MKSKRWLGLWMTLGALVMLGSPVVFADERGMNHAAWDALLYRHVDAHGVVDYRAWREEARDALGHYLQRLAQVDVSPMDRDEALAFWINAYVHFALVCASSSCPSLVREAYVPERLNEQLAEQTRRFLADPQRGLRVEGRTLWLSKIFDWYKSDFIPAGELGWLGRLTPEKLLPHIELYLDGDIAQAIRSRQLVIKFLDYDWSLNAQHQ